uniref:Uncharacterized protein n=1 Tax=Caenorhabditis japonica TaxID=281687 RepID=A0A8R1I722_CAEJA
MRKNLRIAIPLLLLSFTFAHVPSVEEILQTNQYLLISQQDGYTFIESNIPAGTCPRTFVRLKTNRPKNFQYRGSHLVRDVNDRIPPKMMIIREEKYYWTVRLFSINVTANFVDSFQKPTAFIDSTFDIDKHGNRQEFFKHNQKLRGTLFDSTSHMLYLDYSTPEKLWIEQYFVRGLFSAQYKLELMKSVQVETPNSRFEWTEDQYAGKFYYKEKMDDEIFLFEVPMGAYFTTVLDGLEGRRVGKLTDDGNLHGATGGAFFTISKQLQNQTYVFSTSLIPASLEAGLSCKIKTNQVEMPRFNNFIIVRNHDYCMLRDGGEYSKENCEEERRQYLALIEGEKTDTVKWLLIICMILFMLIVLLFVYIYWLRSTFISEEERTQQNEQTRKGGNTAVRRCKCDVLVSILQKIVI